MKLLRGPKRRTFAAILIAVSLGQLSTGASAQEGSPLESDLSRGQLFQLFVRKSQGGLFALNSDFIFPADVKQYGDYARAGKIAPGLFGIDVSHHNLDNCNCTISWDAIAATGVQFAYVKASQGTASQDPRLPEYWKGISSLPADKKIYKGAYHFLSADGLGEKQAEWFLKNFDAKLLSAGQKYLPDDLPPFVDLEWDHRVDRTGRPVPCSDGKIHNDCWELLQPAEILERLTKWIAFVKDKTGRNAGIYTNLVWWNERIKDQNAIKRFAANIIWIADYLPHTSKDKLLKRTLLTAQPGVPGKAPWTAWQFSEAAAFALTEKTGIYKVDANLFRGDLGKFKSTFGIPR